MMQTITELAPRIQRGELTPSELLEQCLANIDRHESRVHAWVYLDRDRARAEAEQLTHELKAGQYRGPLHGIPIGVKDIIDVFDMPTGCGSKQWANSYARQDAKVVARLRQAGALILGKTVTTPYAFLDPPITRNPWNTDRTPGGSSSGSAAAVACGMCLAALGTQTGGSITRPAAYCGVCSIKPSHGRVSVDGVLPLAPSLDHVGAMANCVRDLAVLFEVMAGLAVIPAATFRVARRLSPDCKERAPSFVRLRGYFDELADPELRTAIERVSYELRSRPDTDTVVSEGMPPAAFAQLPRHHRTIMAVEAAQYHGSRFTRHPEEYPPKIRELIEEGLQTNAVAYREAQLHRDALQVEFDDLPVFTGIHLTPAATGTAPDTSTTGNPAYNAPWSYTGLPTVSLPIGFTSDGMPLAVQLVGTDGDDGELLAAAAWVERAIAFERRALSVG